MSASCSGVRRDGDQNSILRVGKDEIRRHHADDRDLFAVHQDLAVDDAGVATKPPLPERIADDRRSRLLLHPGEDPSQDRVCADT